MKPPRIVCLSTETAELCFALGLGSQVVGRSSFCERPPAVKDVRVVSSFTEVRLERVREVAPDIVLAFSDLQAEPCQQLVKAGFPVLALNQRTLAETLQSVRWVGGLLGVPERAEVLVADMEARMERVRAAAAAWPVRPRVYFEEWDSPLITGIGWVGELITLAGGDDVFAHLSHLRSAKERVVDPGEVISAAPDVILASWCGKPFRDESVRARPGWDAIPAVRGGQLHALPGAEVLSPGLSLVDGLERIHGILGAWVRDPSP
jgi:iron complex transport system substrate-binding protein